jgi:hypothetical protein
VAGKEVETAAVIPERFNGPPASANGGFACGTVARLIHAEAAEVSLRRPPPLGRPLGVERDGRRVALLDNGEVVAEGKRSAGIEAEPPRAVDLDEAAVAGRRYPWLERHPYPTCFVCGPRRTGDGLELFAGPTEDGRLFAAEWTPGAEWDEGGRVREEIVWAALDCPSAVPVMSAEALEGEAVLARLAAAMEGPIVPGRPHVVLAWALGADGRKRHSASAILDEDGAVLARAEALWIELRAD